MNTRPTCPPRYRVRCACAAHADPYGLRQGTPRWRVFLTGLLFGLMPLLGYLVAPHILR